MNQIIYITLVTMLTGLAGLGIGLLARSVRIALGCSLTAGMVGAGIIVANLIWEAIH